MELRLDYELTEEDYVEFNLEHLRRSPSIVRRRWIRRLVLPIVFAGFAVYFMLSPGVEHIRALSLLYFLIAIIWAVFYDKYYYYRARKNLAKMMSEGSNQNMVGKYELIANEDSVRILAKSGETEHRGPFILKTTENDRYIFAYISSVSALIIPKRALYAESEAAQVREVLNQFAIKADATEGRR